MSTIDSLDIQIQASAQKANQEINKLVVNIGKLATALKIDTSGLEKIGKKIDLSGISEQAKTISASVEKMGAKISQSMKPVQEQAQKVSKDLSQITEQYKNLGKGLVFSGNATTLQKQIDSYSNALEKAKLKKQELEASGKTEGQMYEYAVRDVIKYTNVIEGLKKQLDSIEVPHVDLSTLTDSEFDKWLESLPSMTNKVTQDINSSFSQIEMPKFKEIDIEALNYDAQAMKSVFGEVTAEIQNYTDAVKRFGNQAGKVLNEPVKTDLSKMSEKELDEWFSNLPSIKAQTEKTVSNISNSLKQLEKPRSINVSIESLNYSADAMKAVFGETTEEIKNFQNATQQLGQQAGKIFNEPISQIEQFKQKLNSLEVVPIQEENLVKLQNSLKKTEAKLEELRANLANGLEMGRITESIDDKGYVKLQEQIALTEKQIDALREKIGNTSGFERFKQSMSGMSTAGKQMSKALSSINTMLKKLNKGINSVLSKIGKLVKSMFSLGDSANKTGKGFNLSLKTILKYGFGIRSLYVLVNKLRSAVKDGMKNLVQYSDQTNQSVSVLNSSMNQFKNAAAAAFAPILNTIAPALNTIIQLFIKATNAVNQFFAALTGQSSWIRAKYVYDDVAESISGASKAAKSALQPFDALNNLTTQNGGGAGDISAEDMFETLPIEDKFKDLSEQLRHMWDEADFYNLGKKIGDDLKRGLEDIPWEEIKATARKIGKSLATLINGLVEVEGLGYTLGKTLAELINTAFEFLNSFVHNLDWASIGQFIADSINGFIQNIDWDLIKDTLVTGAKGLADTINNFVKYLDWDTVASTISNAVNTLSQTVIAFFENTDWSELGHKIGYTLEKAIEDIDFEQVGRAIADVVQAGLDFFSGLIDELDWSEIKQAIKDLFKGFFDNIEVPDNLKGVISGLIGLKIAILGLTAIKGIAEFTILMVNFGKAIGTIKTLLGAGTAAEAGTIIGTSLLAGLAGALAGGLEADFLNHNVIGPIVSLFDEELGNAYKNFSWFGEGGFFDALNLEDFKGAISEVKKDFDKLGEGISQKWDNIKENAKTAWETISLNLSEKWETIKSNASTKFEEIKSNISEKWENLKTKTSETWENTKTNLLEKWESLKTNASTKFGEIEKTVSDAWSKLKENTTNTWNGIKTAIKVPINAIIGFINKMISGVVSGINSMTSALNTINFKIPDGFPIIGGKEFKINIPKVNAPQIPYLANGAVFNGGNPYLAVVNDQPRGQTNIEAPLDTIRQALRMELYNEQGYAAASGNDYIRQIEDATYRGMMRAISEMGGIGTQDVNVILEGDAGKVFKLIQDEANDFKIRNGKPAFT